MGNSLLIVFYAITQCIYIHEHMHHASHEIFIHIFSSIVMSHDKVGVFQSITVIGQFFLSIDLIINYSITVITVKIC